MLEGGEIYDHPTKKKKRTCVGWGRVAGGSGEIGSSLARGEHLYRSRLAKLLLELGCVRSFRLLVVLNVGEVPPVGFVQ